MPCLHRLLSSPLAGLPTLLLAAACGAAHAGAFSVSPVRLHFEPRDRAVALTLVNDGDTEVALQADVLRWSQDGDGADRLEPSDDLVVSPPILKLPAQGRQVVRIARLSPADRERQQTYRLLVRELPAPVPADGAADAGAAEGKTQVPISLVLSIPVFLTPGGARQDVQCEVLGSTPAAVACHNAGRAHAQVRGISLEREGRTLARFDGAVYLLPGSRRVLPLRGVDAEPLAPGDAELRVRLDEPQPRHFPARLP